MQPQHRIVMDPDLLGQSNESQLIPPEPVPAARETRRRVDDSEPQPDENETTVLSDEERADLSILLTVGRRTKTISVMGHKVMIQNLNTDDDLRVGLFCRDYQGAPPAEQRSYQLAVCAAGVRQVDGVDLVTPLRQLNDDEMYTEKVAALRQYYPVVITQIYNEILKLDAEFWDLWTKLGKAEG